MSLPPLGAITETLDFHPEKEGLEVGPGGKYARYRVQEPGQLITAPDGWIVPSVGELVKMRVEAMELILQKGGINLEVEDPLELQRRIAQHSQDILLAVRTDAQVWQGRYNTRTITMRDGNGQDALIVDVNQKTFRDIGLVRDYSALRDGGVQLHKEEVPGDIVGEISGKVYSNPQLVAGGDKNLGQLFSHPVIAALIKDETLRSKYLSALGVLNSLGFFKTGSNSIWVPDKLPAWFFRWHALGFEADAFYPPNLGTKRFEMYMTPEKR